MKNIGYTQKKYSCEVKRHGRNEKIWLSGKEILSDS